MTIAPPYKLGQVVQDRFSGLRGYTIAAYVLINGTLQYSVQPKGDGEKMPEAIALDYQSLVLVPEDQQDATAPLVEVPATLGSHLGLKAKDKVTGSHGVVTAEQFFHSGCHYGYLTTKATDKNHEPIVLHIAMLRIEILHEQPVVERPKKEPPGGPSRAHQRAF